MVRSCAVLCAQSQGRSPSQSERGLRGTHANALADYEPALPETKGAVSVSTVSIVCAMTDTVPGGHVRINPIKPG